MNQTQHITPLVTNDGSTYVVSVNNELKRRYITSLAKTAVKASTRVIRDKWNESVKLYELESFDKKHDSHVREEYLEAKRVAAVKDIRVSYGLEKKTVDQSTALIGALVTRNERGQFTRV